MNDEIDEQAPVETAAPAAVIGIVRETAPGETRVAGTPATVAQLIKLGYRVAV